MREIVYKSFGCSGVFAGHLTLNVPVGKESPRLNCGRTGSSVKIRFALPPGFSDGSSSSAGRFIGAVDKF